MSRAFSETRDKVNSHYGSTGSIGKQDYMLPPISKEYVINAESTPFSRKIPTNRQDDKSAIKINAHSIDKPFDRYSST